MTVSSTNGVSLGNLVTVETNPLTGRNRFLTPGGSVAAVPPNSPSFLFIGDSTVMYGSSTTGAPTSVIYNGDGTATMSFASSQNIQAGDTIGVFDSGNLYGFASIETPVISISGSGPYLYTYAPDSTPTVSTHPTPANTAIVYRDRKASAGPSTEFAALFGGGVNVYVSGNGGDDIDNIIARIDAALELYAPTHVVLTHGINDCYRSGKTVAQVIAAYTTLLNKVDSAGATLDLISPPPQPNTRTNWTTTTRDYMISLRAAQAEWCKANQVDYFDWYAQAAGSVIAVNPTDANANPSSNMIQSDNIHPTLALDYLIGKALATKYRTMYPSAKAPLPISVLDGGIMANPLFTGTAGTRTNGTGTVAAGNVADSVDITVTAGTATVTPYQTARTVAADGDSCGNWQGATVVAVAAGDTVQMRLEQLSSKVVNGGIYRVVGQIKLKTGPSLCKELSMILNSQTATTGNKTFWFRGCTSTQQAPHPETAVFTIDTVVDVRTPQATHGAPSSFRPTIQMVAAGSGTIEFEVAKFSVRKLN